MEPKKPIVPTKPRPKFTVDLVCSRCQSPVVDGQPTCRCMAIWRAEAAAIMLFMTGCLVAVLVAAVVCLVKAVGP